MVSPIRVVVGDFGFDEIEGDLTTPGYSCPLKPAFLQQHPTLVVDTRHFDGAFVARLVPGAEAANHHPDILLTYPEVTVTLSSHDVGGVTSRDLALAETVSAHAEELGVTIAAD